MQNINNHRRFHPLFHYFAIPLTILGLLFSGFYGIQNNLFIYSVIALVFVLIFLALLFARTYALKMQNRVIRAEENFRYYLLTQQRLPTQLKMTQLIALRFASDEEFVNLVQKTLAENLSPQQIKSQINNWRSDYYRV